MPDPNKSMVYCSLQLDLPLNISNNAGISVCFTVGEKGNTVVIGFMMAIKM